MNTVEILLKRFKDMERIRAPYENVWREEAQLFQPMKGLGFNSDAGEGQAGDEYIWDSTPGNAKGMMDARVFGMVMNPAEKWLGLGFRDMRNGQGESDDFKEWAAEAAETILDVASNEETNFYTAGAEALEEESLFGTSVKFTDEDDDSFFRVQAIPLSECYVAENHRGVIDTVFRKYKMTVRQCVQEWGEKGVSQETLDLWKDDKPEEKIDILHCTYPRTDRAPKAKGNRAMPFACVYMEVKAEHILEEKGYHEFPYSCPRWEKGAGEVYGRGAALPALADVRVLYAMMKTALMAAEKASNPALTAPDDGFLGPINSSPGGISYYRAGTQDKIEKLPFDADIGILSEMLEGKRMAVREWFYSNQFDDSSRPNMTATEAQLKYTERWKTLASVLGRLQSEDLTPQILRVLMLLMRRGVVKPMPAGYTVRNIRLFYTGPLTMAQKQSMVQGIRVYLEGLAMAAQLPGFQEIADNADPDAVAKHLFDASGAPSDTQRKKREVEGIRGKRAQQAQNMAAMQQADAIANTAKTASEVDLGSPNGATALLGMGGQA